MDESELLAQRVIYCLPAATLELDTFCQLIGIHASREVESAAVETGARSRMLINPDFVKKYCKRDEHLFLLVMHELWHILLAHTRLFPRAILVDNIAFDAIINAGLTLQFPGPEYRGFLESINPADIFPNLLLRPPAGWPDQPRYPLDNPRGICQILERLYHPASQGGKYAEPLYEEIRELLRANIDVKHGTPLLLGNHDDQDNQVMKDPLVRDVLRRIVSSWPPPPMPLKGRSSSGDTGSWTSLIGSSNTHVQREFARILKLCLSPVCGSHRRRQRQEFPIYGGTGVLPYAKDRLHPARKLLGAGDLLWQQPFTIKSRIEQPAQANVYFDVSGSMFKLLPELIHLVLPYAARGDVRLYQFSGIVEPLYLTDLQSGKIRTSRGTDINCVLEHLFNNRIRIALILTDGCTGVARDDYTQQMKKNNVRLHVVLPHESHWIEDLEGIASSMNVLPPKN